MTNAADNLLERYSNDPHQAFFKIKEFSRYNSMINDFTECLPELCNMEIEEDGIITEEQNTEVKATLETTSTEPLISIEENEDCETNDNTDRFLIVSITYTINAEADEDQKPCTTMEYNEVSDMHLDVPIIDNEVPKSDCPIYSCCLSNEHTDSRKYANDYCLYSTRQDDTSGLVSVLQETEVPGVPNTEEPRDVALNQDNSNCSRNRFGECEDSLENPVTNMDNSIKNDNHVMTIKISNGRHTNTETPKDRQKVNQIKGNLTAYFKTHSNNPMIYQFIGCLLNDPDSQDKIYFCDAKGSKHYHPNSSDKTPFVYLKDTKFIGKMWGLIKGNKNMDYPTFSRALRKSKENGNEYFRSNKNRNRKVSNSSTQEDNDCSPGKNKILHLGSKTMSEYSDKFHWHFQC